MEASTLDAFSISGEFSTAHLFFFSLHATYLLQIVALCIHHNNLISSAERVFYFVYKKKHSLYDRFFSNDSVLIFAHIGELRKRMGEWEMAHSAASCGL